MNLGLGQSSDPYNLLQQLGLMGGTPATQPVAGESNGEDQTLAAMTQMGLGNQNMQLSPQMLMQQARLRSMYNHPHLLGGGRTQGLPGGAYPGGNLLQPGFYPGQAQQQPYQPAQQQQVY